MIICCIAADAQLAPVQTPEVIVFPEIVRVPFVAIIIPTEPLVPPTPVVIVLLEMVALPAVPPVVIPFEEPVPSAVVIILLETTKPVPPVKLIPKLFKFQLFCRNVSSLVQGFNLTNPLV